MARSKVVSTDRLVDLIWGDNPPKKPYVAIRSYISHLRKELEPGSKAGDRRGVLVTQSPGYALQIEPDAVDAFRFEAAITKATNQMADDAPAEALLTVDGALSLWNSTDLSDSPLALFVGEVDRLLELRHRAVVLCYDAKLATGSHQEIVADLRSLVDADPTQERHLSQLMIALYRSGRPAEAVQAYQAGLKATIEATGLEPSPALADLERRILQSDKSLDWVSESRQPVVNRTVEEGPIGRSTETAQIAEALHQPKGRLIALSGEPGIGKTEMMRFAAQSARGLGQQVVWGFGHRDSRSVPLAPWRAVIAGLVESIDDDDLSRFVGERGPQLAMLAPAIGGRLDLEAEEARDVTTLKEAASWFLRRVCSETPLLICLDDLHWTDDSSLAMLSYLVPNLADQPISFIVSWRDTESLNDEQSLALAELGRLAEGYRIELTGLGVAAVGKIWSGFGQWAPGDEPDEERIADLQKRTAGNPLFVKELIRSEGDPGRLEPNATINDVIAARLGSVPEESRKLLSIGSLCPGGFNERLLAELSSLDEDDLLHNLELLMAARLIEEDPVTGDSFNFTHSLIGESLSAQMSGVRKARLHTQIATALEKEQATIDQLAHHLLRGASSGDPVVAATSALAAAREAAKLHDHGSAIDLIERGLAALERADDDELRAQLMVDLAQERKHKEHHTQSHAAALEGFRLAKRAGDIDLMVAAALAFCGQGNDDNRFGISWLGYWNPPGPALDMLGQCLEKLESGPQRVVVLIAYASQLFGEFDYPAEAAIILEEAVADARQSPHQELLAAALSQEIFTLQRHMPYHRRKANIEESITVAHAMGTPTRIVAANRALTILRLDEDDMAGARETIEACNRALADKDEPALSLFVESMTIALDMYQGKLDQAETSIQQAMARYDRIGSAALDLLGIQYATLLREQGKLEEVENLMRWKVSGYPGPAYGVALAMVLAEQGKTEEALDALADYGGDGIESGGEGVLQFMTTSFYAETIMSLGDIERARKLYPAIAGSAQRTVAMYSGIVIFGSGSLYLGRLATLLGRFDEATNHLDAALVQHRAVGARPYELRTLLAKIDLLSASGQDSDGAGDLGRMATEARQLADQLNMGWLIEARLAE